MHTMDTQHYARIKTAATAAIAQQQHIDTTSNSSLRDRRRRHGRNKCVFNTTIACACVRRDHRTMLHVCVCVYSTSVRSYPDSSDDRIPVLRSNARARARVERTMLVTISGAVAAASEPHMLAYNVRGYTQHHHIDCVFSRLRWFGTP